MPPLLPSTRRSMVTTLAVAGSLALAATASAQSPSRLLDHPTPATFAAPGQTTAPAHRAASPTRPDRTVSGRLVVRFEDHLDACVATAFATGDAPDGDVATLARSLRGLGIEAMQPVHRTADEQAALRRGRNTIPLAELLAHHRAEIEKVAGRRGLAAEKLASLPALHHVYTLDLAPGADTPRAIETLAADPRVRWVEPIRLFTTETLPDDPLVDPDGDGTWQAGSWGQDHADQWGLESMGWEAMWSDRHGLWSDPARVGGGGVTIAIVDTGVDYDHPDLAANIWRDAENRPGIDFVDIDVQAYLDEGFALVDGEDYTTVDHDPLDRHGHGTHVAGIAAAGADDGFGMAGVAWKASILPVRAGFVLDLGEGRTTGALENDDIAAAIAWAAEAGADILNFSFGGLRDAAISDAVAYAHGLGVLMVASAGNFDTEVVGNYPATEPWVLAVGATDATGAKAAFSNWGARLDLAAPGKDIVSTRAADTLVSSADERVGEHHIRASGTSMAAPHVAGALALILSAHPEIAYDDWRGRLLATARPLPDLLPGLDARLALGAGVPDLLAALTASPRPHAALVSVRVVPRPPSTPSLGGNTTIDAGETADLHVGLRNLWSPATTSTVEPTGNDPWVSAMDRAPWTEPWPNRDLRFEVLEIQVDTETPRYHHPDLGLVLDADGIEQPIDLPLVVNGPRSVVLVPEDYDVGHSYGFRLHTTVEGRVLATWTQYLRAHDRYEVHGAFFDSDGRPIGAASFRLHDEDTAAHHADVVAHRRADGRWIAAWRRIVDLGDGYDITVEVQRFDADGGRLGERVTIADDATTINRDLAVTLAKDGSAAVGWWGSHNVDYSTIRLRFLDPDGRPVGALQTAETFGAGHHSGPALVYGPDDRLLAAWRAHLGRTDAGEHEIHVYARLYDRGGTPLGPNVPINQERSRFETKPGTDADADGFVVAWDWCEPPPGTCSIRGRRLDSIGTPLDAEMVLEPRGDHRADDVDVVVDDGGHFAVVWEACIPSGFIATGCEIRARRFDSTGRPVSDLHRVDSMNPLHDPSLTRVGDGYLVSWNNSGYSPYGDWGQLFRFETTNGGGPCVEDATTLCAQDGRFEVRVDWRDFDGQEGVGVARPLGGTSGTFSFFDPENVEILVKVLDGRGVNGHWWVYTASVSNVEYRLRVRDTATGAVRVYENPAGTFASRGDVTAFADASTTAVDGSTSRLAEASVLELHDRFRVEIAWRDFVGVEGAGHAVPLGRDSGAFWFFDDANVELVVKILDGRPLNGHWWVYFGALSNVAYTVTITDTETGTVREWHNPSGTFASRGDVQAF